MSLNLLPKQEQCPACGCPAYVPHTDASNRELTVCSRECQRLSARTYSDASTHGASIVFHFHVQCQRCQFQWLETVPNKDLLQKAW